MDERLAGLVLETGSPAVVVVWLLLFRQADGRTGRVSRLGSRRVAEVTGRSRNTARAALRALTQAGVIEPGKRFGEYTVAHVYRVVHVHGRATGATRPPPVSHSRRTPDGLDARRDRKVGLRTARPHSYPVLSMCDRQHAGIDPVELAAILEEVRRALLAVDENTGEHRPLRDITLDAAADTVAER